MSIDSSLTKLRVLLVEDEAFLRRITGQVLIGLNIHQALMAEDGKEALSLLNKNDVDLLITDIQMPRVNGLELIKQVRIGATQARRDLRILVVTSFSTTEVVVASLALDVNGFLVKPIKPADTLKKIRIAVNEKTHLKDADTYRQIDTDLESISRDIVARSSGKPHAAILRQEGSKDSPKTSGREISLNTLEPGMRLQEDLKTKTGLTLVSAGQELNESLINRIHELSEVLNTRQVRIR